MGIFSWLTGGAGKAIAEGAEGIGTGVSSIATGIREAITGPEADPTRLAELAAEADQLQVDASRLQTEVNLAEAQSTSLFVAGARPFILWVCGLAVAYKFIVRPIISLWVDAPDVDAGALWPLLTGILGLGGMRSWEKSKGINDRHG